MTGFRVTEEEPAWGRDDRILRFDLPLVWLSLGLAVFGALVLQARISNAFAGELLPAASLATVSWVLYVLPFVAVVGWLDLDEPEPPAFLASAFAWGAVVATPMALVANPSGQRILADVWGSGFAADWWTMAVGPVTEEVVKALGVVVVVLVARRQLTTVLDGVVYGAFVGLGVQVMENLHYTTDLLLKAHGDGRAPVTVVGDVLVGRGLELGLWSHTAYAALSGFGIAYAVVEVRRSRTRRVAVAVACFAVAWGVHALWNAPFTQVRDGAALGWELLVYGLKGAPALAVVVALTMFARRREVEWFAGALEDEAADVVRAEELLALRTQKGRRVAIAAARLLRGATGARAVRRLQAAQVALAVEKGAGTGASVAAAREEVRAARVALDAALSG